MEVDKPYRADEASGRGSLESGEGVVDAGLGVVKVDEVWGSSKEGGPDYRAVRVDMARLSRLCACLTEETLPSFAR
jgi:hypothetical protein